MKDWQHLDKIFIANAVGLTTPDGPLYKHQLENVDWFDTLIIKPISNDNSDFLSLIYQERLRFYRDGRMERVYLYHTYPEDTIDGIHMINPIGKKMIYNHLLDAGKVEPFEHENGRVEGDN